MREAISNEAKRLVDVPQANEFARARTHYENAAVLLGRAIEEIEFGDNEVQRAEQTIQSIAVANSAVAAKPEARWQARATIKNTFAEDEKAAINVQASAIRYRSRQEAIADWQPGGQQFDRVVSSGREAQFVVERIEVRQGDGEWEQV